MKTLVIFSICLAYAKTLPSYDHNHKTYPLEGVPNEFHYGKLSYPALDILELGTSVKDTLPPTIIQINKKVVIKEPKPYPVKVPVPVPHPIEVPKPFPVVETKIVKVPHPYPVEVIKNVPVPFEVPKPYPVPSEDVKPPAEPSHSEHFGNQNFEHHFNQQAQNFGSFEGSEQSTPEHSFNYDSGAEQSQQSEMVNTEMKPQLVGWVPVQMTSGALKPVVEKQEK